MKKDEINTRYLETICDRDLKKVSQDQFLKFVSKLESRKMKES